MKYNYVVRGRRYIFGLRPYQWGTIGMWVLIWIIISMAFGVVTAHAREDVLPEVEIETESPYSNEENRPEPEYEPRKKNPGEFEYDAPPTRDDPLNGNKNRHGEIYDPYEEDWAEEVEYREPRDERRRRKFKKVIRKIRTILDIVEAFADGGPIK